MAGVAAAQARLWGMAASMVCLDARHAKKALDMKVNKTDANDAEGVGTFGACRLVP
jgi:hypothetical protein